MKIQLGKIVNSKNLLEQLVQEKFPVKTSYAIQKNFKIVLSETKEFEEKRSKLIMEEYGVQQIDAEGNKLDTWKVPDDKMMEYSGEMEKLFSFELDLPLFKIVLPETYEITPLNISIIEWMIDFGDDKENIVEESKKEEN